MSATVKRLILAVAIAIPFVLTGSGALIGEARGNALLGALVGAITTALIIGSMWLLLGAYAAHRELQMRRDGRDRLGRRNLD